ncbi:MAG TPA: Rieske (2Fe-2S) protein [Xanthomonadales bacterium]|nr:Rieske (2Fe-2S) protein [Xanthomonadales bacterium]
MKVAAFLALTIAGALGATVAAAVGAEPAVLAGALVLAFFGLAGAAASAAIALHAPDDLEEPRVARGPSAPSPIPDESVSRGTFGRLWFAALGAFAVLGFVPLVSLARKPGRSTVSGWGAGVRLVDDQNRPIARDHLVDGGIETVFPQNGVELPDAPAVLVRIPPDLRQAVHGAPDGYLAFSKICTHAGCPVALYREASHELYCPCHQSRFDVLNGAKNVSGPAPRPLPRLAVAVDAEGYLVASGDFDAPVGPDDWNRRL